MARALFSADGRRLRRKVTAVALREKNAGAMDRELRKAGKKRLMIRARIQLSVC